MNKRKKFIFTSLCLSLGFIAIQFLPENYKLLSIFVLGVASTLLFSWSLWEGLKFNVTLLSLILPIYFTVGVGLFWFLLPSSIYTVIPIILLYGFGVYALCLTANIYTVAVIRTIALMRAARGVGFILTLITLFLIFDTIVSIHWPIYVTVPLVFLTSFPLFLQGFWSISLDKVISKDVFLMTLIASLVVAETSAILFFWPLTVVVRSLFLTVYSYVVLGLGQAELEGKLFRQTVNEYLFMGTLVFLGMFLATDWGR